MSVFGGDIVNFTKCSYTYKQGAYKGQQCGDNGLVKGFCQYHYNNYHYVTNNILLL